MYDLFSAADVPQLHDDGSFISAEISRVVKLIREYDPNLDVKWIPPALRQPGDAAFAITERLRSGQEVVAFYVQTEEEFTVDVLARIYEGDNSKQDVQTRINAKNSAIERMREEKFAEERALQYDLMASIVRSKKHTYRHNGRKFNL